MDSWLAFLSCDQPEEIISLITAYPEFKPLYQHIYDMCENVERVMELFSKELRILDKNTVRYMVDQMENEIEELKQELEGEKEKLEEHTQKLEGEKKKLEEHTQKLEGEKKMLEEHAQELERRNQMLEAEYMKELEEKKMEIIRLKEELMAKQGI